MLLFSCKVKVFNGTCICYIVFKLCSFADQIYTILKTNNEGCVPWYKPFWNGETQSKIHYHRCFNHLRPVYLCIASNQPKIEKFKKQIVHQTFKILISFLFWPLLVFSQFFFDHSLFIRTINHKINHNQIIVCIVPPKRKDKNHSYQIW